MISGKPLAQWPGSRKRMNKRMPDHPSPTQPHRKRTPASNRTTAPRLVFAYADQLAPAYRSVWRAVPFLAQWSSATPQQDRPFLLGDTHKAGGHTRENIMGDEAAVPDQPVGSDTALAGFPAAKNRRSRRRRQPGGRRSLDVPHASSSAVSM